MLVEGPPPGTSDERIWEALLRELQWLFRQMNRKLRKTFSAVFLLFELKTIILCLRRKSIGGSNDIEMLLAHSLLAEPVLEALRRGSTVRATAARVTDTIAATANDFRQLESAYAEKGLKGFESRLTRLFLQHVLSKRLHPVIREFFVSFIDLRNIMLLYKQLRWEIKEGLVFVSGGSIELARLEQILAGENMADLDALVTGVTGLKTPTMASTEAAAETVLLSGMTRKLRKIARDNEGVGPILDYMWRIYIQARNLAVLYHGKDLGVETLERELIR